MDGTKAAMESNAEETQEEAQESKGRCVGGGGEDRRVCVCVSGLTDL